MLNAPFSNLMLCISETWLSPDIKDNELSIDGYRIFRLDRNRHGGGVVLVISRYCHTKSSI